MFSNTLATLGRAITHTAPVSLGRTVLPNGGKQSLDRMAHANAPMMQRMLTTLSSDRMRELLNAADSPILKSMIIIDDTKSLQAVRSRLPCAHSAADGFLATLRNQAGEAAYAEVQPGDERAMRERVKEDKSGDFHLVSAKLIATAAVKPVWKIYATDQAPGGPAFTVSGEYYCIAPTNDVNVEIMKAAEAADGLEILRACAAHDVQSQSIVKA